MQWIEDYQLFLFDLDGLLVNTEEIHFTAYKKMCEARGYKLPWDFARYCQEAHYDSEKLKNSLYADLPALHREEPNWDVLYSEKKKEMMALLNGGAVHMMPGAERLLRALAVADIPRCVVTHSPDEQIQIIKRRNPFGIRSPIGLPGRVTPTRSPIRNAILMPSPSWVQRPNGSWVLKIRPEAFAR